MSIWRRDLTSLIALLVHLAFWLPREFLVEFSVLMQNKENYPNACKQAYEMFHYFLIVYVLNKLDSPQQMHFKSPLLYEYCWQVFWYSPVVLKYMRRHNQKVE